jgi:hypothetical protein
MNLLDDDKLFLTSAKALVYRHQFYSMSEFFACTFRMFLYLTLILKAANVYIGLMK